MNVHIINPYFTQNINDSLKQLNVIQQIENNIENCKKVYYNKPEEYIKEKPIIKLMLEEASHNCNLDDFIIIHNSDCIPNKTIYKNLDLLDNNKIYMLYRLDIDKWDNQDCIPKLRYMTNNGIDGFIISKKMYEKIKEEIPPLVFGEPHWDNVLFTLFQKHSEVVHLRGTLFHIEHHRKWVTENNFHNSEWMETNRFLREEIEYKQRGKIELSIITSFYNPTEERIKATLEFINKLPIQSINFELIFIELYDGEPIFNHLNNYLDKFSISSKKINVEIQDTNNSLFQRECLYNKYYKEASSENILFLDCDVMSFDFMWFNKIVENLNENDVVQCFKEVKDTKDHSYHYQSTFKKCVFGVDSGLPDNPGIGWAMKKSFLEDINGFNTKMIFGGSDSCFFEEITKRKVLKDYNTSIRELKAYKNNIRDLKRDVNVSYVDVDLIHFNHGMTKDRKYYERHLITDYVNDVMKKEMEDFIEFGELLSWKNPINPLRFIYEHRSKINHYKPIQHINEIYYEYIDLYKNDSQSITLFSYKNIPMDYWQYVWGSNVQRYHKGIPVSHCSLFGFDSIVCKKEDKKGRILFGLACNKHWVPVKIKNSTLNFFIKKGIGDIKVNYQTNDKKTIEIYNITNCNNSEFLVKISIENVDNLMCIMFDSECEFSISNIFIE